MVWGCVSYRASSQVCRSPEERWTWEHPALHLQKHSGTKSSLKDETSKAAYIYNAIVLIKAHVKNNNSIPVTVINDDVQDVIMEMCF